MASDPTDIDNNSRKDAREMQNEKDEVRVTLGRCQD